jgi:predicted PurR-regulated permease PerM
MNHTDISNRFFFILLAISTVLVFFVFQPYLTGLIVAGTFAVIFQPVYNFLLRVVRIPSLAALGTLVTVIMLVLIPLIIFGKQVTEETYTLYQSISSNSISYPEVLNRIEEKVNIFIPEFSVDLGSYVSQAVSLFFGNFGSFFAGTLNVFVNLIIGLFSFFYFLKDGKQFKNTLMKLSPLPTEYDEIILKRLDLTVNSVIKGTVTIALIQGFVAGIGLTFFGVPNPALWASLAAVCALVPGVGTSLVMIPAIIFLFLTGQDGNAFGLLLWALFAVGLIDNFLSPKVISRGIRIHPLFILISVLGGVTFFGPFGFLLGPLTVAVFFSLFDIYQLIVNPSLNHESK